MSVWGRVCTQNAAQVPEQGGVQEPVWGSGSRGAQEGSQRPAQGDEELPLPEVELRLPEPQPPGWQLHLGSIRHSGRPQFLQGPLCPPPSHRHEVQPGGTQGEQARGEKQKEQEKGSPRQQKATNPNPHNRFLPKAQEDS
ncbi:hypothetical protein scyTo_0017993 [Scyliorhinus torazame]|uniref:Uncharacterized protein n=1 Tax=Scyliorhinus torazame TaxID=75743 RepID=A0A401Q3M5_SCYTO|nr:hypothetical protein [Scyliorhinus torazame]